MTHSFPPRRSSDLTGPLFKAAGLDIASVDIYLVKDKRLNAFVAGGQKLFIHTGLLQRADGPGQVIGVLAHELGHIAGGHLARLQDGLSKATAQSIVAMVLGGAAALASGSGDALAATLAGSQPIGQRTILQYTRSMEQADRKRTRLNSSNKCAARMTSSG